MLNEKNYGSLEASQRLVKAGIVLETTFCRDLLIPNKVILWPSGVEQGHPDFVPAYQFTEVWRELLPLTITLNGDGVSIENGRREFKSPNPTDALIDLLIWVTEWEKEESHE